MSDEVWANMTRVARAREIMETWRPGSGDWDWDEEARRIGEDYWRPGVDDDLRASIRDNGVLEPIMIGDDGRVWEGHHRLWFAAECAPESLVPYNVGRGGAPETGV